MEGIESQVYGFTPEQRSSELGRSVDPFDDESADSAAALRPIAPLVRDDTTILCLQNGSGANELHEERSRSRNRVARNHQFGAVFKSPA